MYSFHTGKELLEQTKKHKMPISEVVINYEMNFSDMSRKAVITRMKKRLKVMREAVESIFKHPRKSISGMSGDATPKMKKVLRNPSKMILGKYALKALTYALATGENNASMGCIVAFPTAGASGVIPGVLFATAEKFKLKEADILKGLFTAAGIGIIIAENATLAGAEGGCQAEIGSAAAMGAAAITEMRGGTPEQCFNAAALALKNLLGLTCDPVGGMVEIPCIKRNALAAAHTLGASDMTIAGIESFVPFDQVVETMANIGKLISPKLRETSLGGLAVTKTAKQMEKKLGIKINNS